MKKVEVRFHIQWSFKSKKASGTWYGYGQSKDCYLTIEEARARLVGIEDKRGKEWRIVKITETYELEVMK